MPRSRINGNFIDKTFSIVANILLRIIPTTSGEKEAFTYYRDGVIFFFLFTALELVGIERFSITLRLLKVKFIKKTIPSVVYPRLTQPQMLQLSILALSERLRYTYGYGFCIAG